MKQPNEVLATGTRIRTHDTLGSTEGFRVASRHIQARRAATSGTISGFVGGGGGDAYWIWHPGLAVLAVYGVSEFDLEGHPGDEGSVAVPTAA